MMALRLLSGQILMNHFDPISKFRRLCTASTEERNVEELPGKIMNIEEVEDVAELL